MLARAFIDLCLADSVRVGECRVPVPIGNRSYCFQFPSLIFARSIRADTLSHATPIPEFFIYVGFLVEFLQLLSFTMDISLSTKNPWNAGTIGWLASLSTGSRLYSFAVGAGASLRACLYASAGVLVAALALVAFVSSVEYRGGKSRPAIAAAAFWLSNGVARPLFIPVPCLALDRGPAVMSCSSAVFPYNSSCGHGFTAPSFRSDDWLVRLQH